MSSVTKVDILFEINYEDIFDRIVSKTDLTESLLERVSLTVLSIYRGDTRSSQK